MCYFMDDWSTAAVAEARRADIRREADAFRLRRMLAAGQPPRRSRRAAVGLALIRAGSWIAGIAPEQIHPGARQPAAG